MRISDWSSDVCSSDLSAEPKELNFGIISTESSQNLKAQWDPFLAAMSKRTGMKINSFFAPDYAGIIQGMRFDKVDVAWYGNKSAMETVRSAERREGKEGVSKCRSRLSANP